LSISGRSFALELYFIMFGSEENKCIN